MKNRCNSCPLIVRSKFIESLFKTFGSYEIHYCGTYANYDLVPNSQVENLENVYIYSKQKIHTRVLS